VLYNLVSGTRTKFALHKTAFVSLNCSVLVLGRSCHSEYESYFSVYISVKLSTGLSILCRKDSFIEPIMCRSTVQGRHLISDDNGNTPVPLS
jgi:hypothetical protein